MKFRFIFKVIAIVYFSFLFAQNGILNVGFDIDDTVLFSRDVFLNLPEDSEIPRTGAGSTLTMRTTLN